MGFFDLLNNFSSDDEEVEPKSQKKFKTKISFIGADKKITSGEYVICGVTPKYVKMNGEYEKSDRLIFLKKEDSVTATRESKIIKSSLDISKLQFADFQKEIFINRKNRAKNWLTNPE